jgi:hypothetical protein
VHLVPNYHDVYIQFFWLITIGIPSLYWLGQFLLASTWFGKMIFALSILIASIVLQRMINMSVIKTDTKSKKN